MRFRQVHKLVSYLLVVAAVGTLVSSSVLPLPVLLVLGGAMAVSWFVEPGTTLGALVERAGALFYVGALLCFGLSLYQVVQSFPEPDFTPFLNFILFVIAHRLFQRRNNRDYLQIYVLSFALVLAGSWLAQSAVFVVAFVAYVILAIWTLILFHLRREIEDNYLVKHLPEAGSEKVTVARVLNSRRVVGRPFFVTTGLVALAVLGGAATVFAVVPRIGVGFFTGTFRRRLNLVGFSDQVTLGYHGVISGDNQTVILRVDMPRIAEIKDPDARAIAIARLYWRGTVYDTYAIDGPYLRWLRSERPETRTIVEQALADDAGRLYVLRHPELTQPRGPTRAELRRLDLQRIQVVGLQDPVAFALDQPVAFQTAPRALDSFLTTRMAPRFGGEMNLRLERRMPDGHEIQVAEFMGAQYTAYSRDPLVRRAPPPASIPLEELPQAHMAPYLAVPAAVAPRVRDLARQITADKTNPLAKVQAIVEWLGRTHGYTTVLQRNFDTADPLEDFLFNQTAGHCEYFAGATFLLARLSGIPTRYVNGLLGGEWNDLGQYIAVRDNRAHAWVEAYVGRLGWIRIDATPAVATPSHMGRISQVWDAIERYWSWWVIDYNVGRQMDLARRLGRGLGVSTPSAPIDLRELKRRAPRLLAGAGVIVGVVALARHLRRRRSRKGAPPPAARQSKGGAALVRLYDGAVQRLGRAGWQRQVSETPREFLDRLALAAHPDAAALATLTAAYERARYGEHPVAELELVRLATLASPIGRIRHESSHTKAA